MRGRRMQKNRKEPALSVVKVLTAVFSNCKACQGAIDRYSSSSVIVTAGVEVWSDFKTCSSCEGVDL